MKRKYKAIEREQNIYNAPEENHVSQRNLKPEKPSICSTETAKRTLSSTLLSSPLSLIKLPKGEGRGK